MSDIERSRFDRVAPYQRGEGESVEEYAAFVEWCKIPPSSRTQTNFCRRTSLTPSWVSRTSNKHFWIERASAFDNASLELRPDPLNMEGEASKAAQLAASQILLELGLSSLQIKNPALIKVSEARQLIKEGAEIMRKAHGEADITVEIRQESMDRVNAIAGEILDLQAEEEEDEDADSEDQGLDGWEEGESGDPD